MLKQAPGAALVTWSGTASAAPFVPDTDFATISEYRRLLREGQFSCMLFDGSLLQLSFSFINDELTKHRMVYFPCPLALSQDELSAANELGFLDLFDLMLTDAVPAADEDEGESEREGEREDRSDKLRLRSPLRFDYDRDAAGEGHPGCHLHIAEESVRWAAFGPLSLGHFVRFVFRHFYPDLWEAHEFLRNWKIDHARRSVTSTEELELFIECRQTIPAEAV